MSRRAVRAIAVNILANTKGLEKGLKQAQRDLNSFSRDLRSAGRFMTDNFTKPILAAGAALTYNMKKATDFGSHLYDLSQRLNVGTDSLQEFEYVGSQLSVRLETLVDINRNLTRTLRQTSDSTSKQSELFRALGVETRNADGSFRDIDGIFWDTRDALSEVEDQTMRNMIAQELFGRSSEDLARLLNTSNEEIEDMRDRFKRLDISVSQENIEGLNEFGDLIEELKLRIRKETTEIAITFLPLFREIADLFSTRVIPAMRLFSDTLANMSTEEIRQIAISAVKLAAVGPALLVASAGVAKLSAGLKFIGKLIAGSKALIGVLKAKGAMALLAKAKFVALGVAVFALINGMRKGLQETNQASAETMNQLSGLATQTMHLIMSVWDLLVGLGQIVVWVGQVIWDWLGSTIMGIVRIFSAAFGVIADILYIFVDLFTGSWEEMGKSAMRAIIGLAEAAAATIETVANFVASLVFIDLDWDSWSRGLAAVKKEYERAPRDSGWSDAFDDFGDFEDMLDIDLGKDLEMPDMDDLSADVKDINVDMESLNSLFSDLDASGAGAADSTENFRDKVVDLTSSIKDLSSEFADMGSAFSKNVIEMMSPSRIAATVRQNTRQIEAWSKSLQRLEDMGVSEVMLGELRGMGVEGLGIAAGLERMSIDQIRQLEQQMAAQRAIATEQAIRQSEFEAQREAIKEQVININIDQAGGANARETANEIVRQLKLAGI